MKDEIKEINIKIPGQILDYVDTKEHLLELFDHIINLQEENKKLKQWNCNKEIIRLNNIIKEVRDYITSHREAVDERGEHILYFLTDDFDENDILEILDKENNNETI